MIRMVRFGVLHRTLARQAQDELAQDRNMIENDSNMIMSI